MEENNVPDLSDMDQLPEYGLCISVPLWHPRNVSGELKLYFYKH